MITKHKLSLIAAGGVFAFLSAQSVCLAICKDCYGGAPLGVNFTTCMVECSTAYPLEYDPTGNDYLRCTFSCYELYGYQLLPPHIINPYLYQCEATSFVSSGVITTYSGQRIPFGPILLTSDTNMPVKLAVTLYNGTNFVPATAATSVTCYAVPLTALSAYSPSNFDQAPWSNLGQGVYNNTNGYWELSWTPTNNEQSYVLDTVISDPTIDSNNPEFVSNGIASFVNIAVPQPATPIFFGSQISATNQFLTTMIAPVGSNYDVQVSTDMKTWSTLTTFTNFVGEAQIADPTTNAVRFYRTLMY